MDLKNKNKGIVLTLVIAILLTVGITAYVYFQSLCTLDGVSVCVDKETGTFLIEEGATIQVQVESEAQANKLVSTWNTLHPDNIGALKPVVKNTLSIDNLKEGLSTDVALVSQDDAAFFMQNFMNLGRRASGVLGDTIPALHQDSINVKGYFFVPYNVTGPLFVYNKTLIESLGYSLEDLDNSGLPDSFESWEKIMDLSKELRENPSVVFPLTFEDQNYFYPFLTGGRWTLNFTKNGSNPEFSSNEFKDGLELIEIMGQYVWDQNVATEVEDTSVTQESPSEEKPQEQTPQEENQNQTDVENQEGNDGEQTPEEPTVPMKWINTAESLPWQYESAFFEGKSLFTIASDFNIFDLYETSTKSEYVYAPFPNFKDHRLTPIAQVEGYVVNSNTKYPSASAEAIRILRTSEFISEYNQNTGKIPVYHRNHIDELNITNEEVLSKVIAYASSDTLPIMALNNNPQVLSKSIYNEIDLMPVLRKLFNGDITVEEAQKEIVLLSEAWISNNDIIEEE